MKKRIILILFAVLLVFTLVGAPVLAKDPDNEAQGQPFQELRDAIDEAVAQMELLIGEVQEELEELIGEVELDIEAMIDDAILALEGQLAELQEQLNDEVAARQNADNQLQNNIDTEETARIVADQALQSQIPDGHSLDAADGSPVDVVYVNYAGKVGIGETNPKYELDVNGNIDVSGSMRWPSSYYSYQRLRTMAGQAYCYQPAIILETQCLRFETTGTLGELKMTPIRSDITDIYATFYPVGGTIDMNRVINKDESYTYTLDRNEMALLSWSTRSGRCATGIYYIHCGLVFITVSCTGEYDQTGSPGYDPVLSSESVLYTETIGK